MIEIHDVTKYYGRVRALHDVSFDVPQGEVVGLLGPNGSGKTTLMRILTGFFPPTSGQVRVGGLSLSDAPLQVRDQIGYLPENVVLYPDMSVRAFLRFCARVKLGNALERLAEVARVLTQCRLEDVAGRRIGALSKGYRQRVGLAQALLGAPRVLILDEPTVGLDPHQVIEMRALIKGLAGETTVLLSSHILSEVGLTCQRVVIIDKGRIIAQDRPDSLRPGAGDDADVRPSPRAARRGPDRGVARAARGQRGRAARRPRRGKRGRCFHRRGAGRRPRLRARVARPERGPRNRAGGRGARLGPGRVATGHAEPGGTVRAPHRRIPGSLDRPALGKEGP